MIIPTGRAIARPRKQRTRFQPQGDRLEQRTLLSTATSASASAGTLAVADVNGDGRPDLVELGPGNTVSIQLNTGPPKLPGGSTFAPPTTYAAAGTPSSVAIADLDGNGTLDLAVSLSTGTGGIAILLGNGDGTFQPTQNVADPAGEFVNDVAIADFNGDGLSDLVVATGSGAQASVTVIPGGGDGTFGKTSVPYTVSTGDTVAVGDFNGDGHPDLVISLGRAVRNPRHDRGLAQ